MLALCVVAGLAASLDTAPVEAIDRQSVEHVMPGLPSIIASYGFNEAGEPSVALVPKHPHLKRQTHFIWGPFSRLFSSIAVLGLCLYAFRRRKERVRPLGWLLGFGFGNLVALAMQDLVRRPDIIIWKGHITYGVTDFAASFPSGYGFRAVFVALIVCALWRRSVVIVAPALAVVIAAIVAGGSHLPTDVIGAVALAVGSYVLSANIAALAAARSLRRDRLREREATTF